MYIYRGEKFNNPNYIKKAKIEHKQDFENNLSFCLQKLKEANEEKEKIKLCNFLINKPINEFNDEEKKKIIQLANSYESVFNDQKLDDNYEVADAQIRIAKKILKKNIVNTLEDVNSDIHFYEDRIKNLQEIESNTFCIALDRDSVTRENIDALKKHILELKKAGAEVHVAVDGNMNTKSNDSQTDYLYTKEEIELLNELDSFLIENDMKPIKICEVQRVDSLDDFDKGWTLQQVATANNKIDSIVERIKENNLSPFEAMLYIHKLASTFKYNMPSKLESNENSRVLPSILNSDKIVCSGYATFVKAIIDKLNMPGLKCDVIGCLLVKRKHNGGHAHNIVSIQDPKYDIDGTYVEDTCWDSPKEGYEKGRGFATCLYPVNDVMNFNNDIGYYTPDNPDRYSNLFHDYDKWINGIKNAGNESKLTKFIDNMKQHFKYRQTPVLVEKYGNHSTPIPLETYRKGLIALYSTVYDDPKKIEELVDQQIHSSIVNGIAIFNSKASNAFTSSIDKNERK